MGNRHNKQRCRSMLPILCSRSSSINDIVLPSSINNPSLQQQEEEDSSSSSSSIITNLEEPLSPKVGCMGQVKKKNNQRSNRVSATHHSNVTPQKHLHKNNTNPARPINSNAVVVVVNYSKPRKLFSGKNLLLSSATTSTSTSIKTTTGRQIRSNSCVGPNPTSQKKQQLSFIREMDPPLPVLPTNNKTQQQENQDSSILWKRRFGDVSSLKTLDLNKLNTIHCRPPPPQPLTV